MVPGFHGLDLVVILVIALLIFGPKKLPEMGSAIGKSIKEFKKGMNELTQPKEEAEPDTTAAAARLDAIEREIASRQAAAEAAKAAEEARAAEHVAPVEAAGVAESTEYHAEKTVE